MRRPRPSHRAVRTRQGGLVSKPVGTYLLLGIFPTSRWL
jgi:hypothetical protein